MAKRIDWRRVRAPSKGSPLRAAYERSAVFRERSRRSRDAAQARAHARAERAAIEEEGLPPEVLGYVKVEEESLLGRAARFDMVAFRVQEAVAREAGREMVRIKSRMVHGGRTVAKMGKTERVLRRMYEAYQVGGLGALERVILYEHERTGRPLRELYTLFFSPEVA